MHLETSFGSGHGCVRCESCSSLQSESAACLRTLANTTSPAEAVRLGSPPTYPVCVHHLGKSEILFDLTSAQHGVIMWDLVAYELWRFRVEEVLDSRDGLAVFPGRFCLLEYPKSTPTIDEEWAGGLARFSIVPGQGHVVRMLC